MDTTALEDEIAALEMQIAELRASKPTRDSTGAHDRQLLLLEDELDDARKATAREQEDGSTAA